jgi:hypothetical protein
MLTSGAAVEPPGRPATWEGPPKVPSHRPAPRGTGGRCGDGRTDRRNRSVPRVSFHIALVSALIAVAAIVVVVFVPVAMAGEPGEAAR